MLTKYKTALVIAPHCDDETIAVGGTISKLLRLGIVVHVIAVSSGERLEEFRKAMKTFGLQKGYFQCLGFPDTYLDQHRQAILNDFRKIKNHVKPDIVFAPSENDLHQDHSTVGKEALREFKDITLLTYDNPWKEFKFEPNVFIELSLRDLHNKTLAIQKYESQKEKAFCNPQKVDAWAIFRGGVVGLNYAEAFELKHMVL